MKRNSTSSVRAFTVFELLIVIAVLMLLAATFLPALKQSTTRSSRISCVYCLKQIGLAYRMWAADNGDKFPMQISTNQGGSLELVLAGDVVSTFSSMSNMLTTPKILLCPEDVRRRVAATNFSSGLHLTNISYFVGIDAAGTNATIFLSGDRNLTNSTAIRRGILELATDRGAGWTSEIHNQSGNVGLADGSVQLLNATELRTALKNTGLATNRLAIP